MVSHATGLREEFLGTRRCEIVLPSWLSLIHLNGMEPQAQKSPAIARPVVKAEGAAAAVWALALADYPRRWSL